MSAYLSFSDAHSEVMAWHVRYTCSPFRIVARRMTLLARVSSVMPDSTLKMPVVGW